MTRVLVFLAVALVTACGTSPESADEGADASNDAPDGGEGMADDESEPPSLCTGHVEPLAPDTLVLSDVDAIEALRGVERLDTGLAICRVPGLVNLSALAALRFVDGELAIGSNDDLVDISALAGLEEVTGRLTFYGNTRLTELVSLTKLTSVGGLELSFNIAIERIGGFDALEHSPEIRIEGADELRELELPPALAGDSHVYVASSVGLDVLSGLEGWAAGPRSLLELRFGGPVSTVPALSFEEIYGVVFVAPAFSGVLDLSNLGHAQMLLLSGGMTGLDLRALRRVGGELQLVETSLANLEGLPALAAVSQLTLTRNPNLRTLAGLGPLRRLESVHIEANPQLEELSGLDGLEEVGGIYICDNARLPACLVDAFVARFGDVPHSDCENGQETVCPDAGAP